MDDLKPCAGCDEVCFNCAAWQLEQEAKIQADRTSCGILIGGKAVSASKELEGGPLTLKDTLHVLRNPWGWSEESVRRVRLHAADLIEMADNHKARLLDAIRSCHSFESARVGHCLACTELSLIGNEGKAQCPTCGVNDPQLHPCDAFGTVYPCLNAFHRNTRPCEGGSK